MNISLEDSGYKSWR